MANHPRLWKCTRCGHETDRPINQGGCARCGYQGKRYPKGSVQKATPNTLDKQRFN